MTQDNSSESTEPTVETPAAEAESSAPAKKAPAKKAAKKAPAKTAAKKAPAKTVAKKATAEKAPAKKTAKKAPAKKAPAKAVDDVVAAEPLAEPDPSAPEQGAADAGEKPRSSKGPRKTSASAKTEQAAPEGSESGETAPPVLFQAPDTSKAQADKAQADKAQADKAQSKSRAPKSAAAAPAEADQGRDAKADQGSTRPSGDGGGDSGGDGGDADNGPESADTGDGSNRRRRRRGGRRRRKSGGDGNGNGSEGQSSESEGEESEDQQAGPDDQQGDSSSSSSSSRRRRRRRRSSEGEGQDGGDDPQNTVTKVRQGRSAEDQITAVTGSTRLEAKKQRRREGREAGRRRAPIVSEAEFLARRESVDRVMAIRQRDDLTQIAVLEDKVLVEHYVARESQTSLIGNVYLGRVQNVLPSMEAAFIDIGKGRNAVLYAGEVNWSALGHKDGQPRKIESVLSSGQSVLVQVTKDPVGHKGARLTSQISLAGRFLVYVPDGTNSGISRKLPDTERNRLKSLLKEIVPDTAGVIVRTAAEGASEEELTRDVERLKARWEDIDKKSRGSAPQLLYGEPDLTLKVVRDLFTEDFSKLVIQGEDAWETVRSYVSHVAPDLEERLERHDPDDGDLFAAAYRIDEQIHKGLDRKVWLPSGGSLIIDRTEAMTVVDVNTGKFTGSGGNLEETVTKNNLEAAEEIVRQLRLRDIGGIIVVDFIDMVLESNRDLVLRRLVECLGRDRTRHQVAEVTSLGLVQMTRKRIGTGLLEAFSETCEHCAGRGLVIADAPVEPKRSDDDPRRSSRRSRRGRSGSDNGGDQGRSDGNGNGSAKPGPSPKDVAAMARPQPATDGGAADAPATKKHADTTDRDREGAASAEAPSPVDGKAAAAERDAGAPDAGRADVTEREPAPADNSEAAEPTTPPEPDRVPAKSGPQRDKPDADRAEVVPEDPAVEHAAGPRQGTTEGQSATSTEPAAPKVVTRTRRRSASRPAGPPAGGLASADGQGPRVGSIGAPPEDGNVEPGTADAEPATHGHVEHVPVKKRGSRKR